ncbi:hypothetical protein B0H13DRAFT_2316433 [Mycena leptocephala]|nr:hypothetical protein B0H13DRAFT_2316433 [Mycena leptocephala]
MSSTVSSSSTTSTASSSSPKFTSQTTSSATSAGSASSSITSSTPSSELSSVISIGRATSSAASEGSSPSSAIIASSKNSSHGAIVGGIIAAVIVVFAVCLALLFVCRQRRSGHDIARSSLPSEPSHGSIQPFFRVATERSYSFVAQTRGSVSTTGPHLSTNPAAPTSGPGGFDASTAKAAYENSSHGQTRQEVASSYYEQTASSP